MNTVADDDVVAKMNEHKKKYLTGTKHDQDCGFNTIECDLKNNSPGKVQRWIDGDTLYVYAKSGDCREQRYSIRVLGIDCPECTKNPGGFVAHYCIQDTNYNDHNEPYGYEAWLAAKKLLPEGSKVVLTCDRDYCQRDNTRRRLLAYLGYEKDGASYDFSTEMARAGMAFTGTNFNAKKNKQICAAEAEALNNGVGFWSLSDKTNKSSRFYEVIKKMQGKKWLNSGKHKNCAGI